MLKSQAKMDEVQRKRIWNDFPGNGVNYEISFEGNKNYQKKVQIF